MAVQFDIEQFQSKDLPNIMGEYWIRVPEQIRLVNRFIFLEWSSARIIGGWVPAASQFEWKCTMTKVIWQNMNIAFRLLNRKEELSGNQKITIPSPGFQQFLQDAAASESFVSFLAAWFLDVTKAQVEMYEQFLAALDPIFDAPTIELLEEIIPKKRLQIKWANEVVHDAVNDQEVLLCVSSWRNYVKASLNYIGGLDERDIQGTIKPPSPIKIAYGPAPQKRSKPEWLKKGDLNNPPTEFSHTLKIFMWHYATEVQVLDLMSYIFYGINDMPFEFYLDLSRHIWDESRHHMMGMRRLKQWGYDAKDIPLPYDEDTLKELEFYYALLTMMGESCSFTRKKKSMDAFYTKGDIISGMTAEIDIVDERTHVKFGKKWAPELYRQKLGFEGNLEDIIGKVMNRVMGENPGLFEDLTEEQKDKISHFSFCGKLEFKYLDYEKQ